MTADPVLRQQLTEAVRASLTRHMLSPYEATAAAVTDDLLQFFEAWGDARVAEAHDETIDILQPLVNYLLDHHPDLYGGNHCIDVALDLLRESDARVAAARAEIAEQIADAIQDTTYYVYPPPEGEERARLSGLRTARDAAAALARSVPGTTEGGNECPAQRPEGTFPCSWDCNENGCRLERGTTEGEMLAPADDVAELDATVCVEGWFDQEGQSDG